jgi:alanyl-tRNA synthetase
MATTERLYYTDSHLTEFQARVINITPRVSGRVGVTLDRTAFYPTGGGQLSDTGTLAGASVIECIDEGEAGVLHLIQGAGPQIGQTVTGRIDWPRRLDHLQQHTAQHILSQAFIQLFGAETRSFRMMQETSEIDVALNDPSTERISRAVELANKVVWENRPVRVHKEVAPAEAARMNLRKRPTRQENLRLIEIEGFDLNACGGTHARATGEVGMIAVRSWERAKGLTRIEFVAGGRALIDYEKVNQTAREVASLFSIARDEAVRSVHKLLEDHKQITRRLRILEEAAVGIEADEIYREAAQPGDGVKVTLIKRIFHARSAESLKQLARALIVHPKTIALLGVHEAAGDARLIFARSSDADGDMNTLMREACTTIGGRGGGRADLAQGGGRCDVERLAKVIEIAAHKLESG